MSHDPPSIPGPKETAVFRAPYRNSLTRAPCSGKLFWVKVGFGVKVELIWGLYNSNAVLGHIVV